jgi:predicted acetyltransferase
MALKLRNAEDADLDKLAELHQRSYPLSKLDIEGRRDVYVNNPRAGFEDVFVVEDGDALIASMTAYRFTQFQENAAIPVVGIANVAVAPDHRREGAAGFLIGQTLKIFEEQEVSASLLHPFSFRFYRNLGWGYSGEIRQHHIKTAQLADYADDLGETELGTALYREDDLSRLMEFYEAQARQTNGLLSRNGRYWRERLVADPREAILALFNGDLIGYMIYSLQEIQSDNFLVQKMEIHEWMAPTLDARDALLGFVARQSDQIESVRITLPPDEPLHLWLDDPRSKNRRLIHHLYNETATIGLGLVYRLVNLKSAFENGRPFNQVKGDLTIEMEDDLLGDRRLAVSFNGKGAAAEEAKSKSGRLLRGSVDILSQIYCGFTSPVQAFELDLVEYEGKDTLDFCQRAFSQPPPRCFDLF